MRRSVEQPQAKINLKDAQKTDEVDSDEVDSCDDESDDGSDKDVNDNVEMRNIGDFMLIYTCTITYLIYTPGADFDIE